LSKNRAEKVRFSAIFFTYFIDDVWNIEEDKSKMNIKEA
jgi:hypothetical protein